MKRWFRHLKYHIRMYGWKDGLYTCLIWDWFGPLKYGIQNCIKYFKVVWEDRDWDYHFWLKMNYAKLKSMEHNIRNNGNHVYCARDADNIKKAMLAIKRLIDDDYHENAFKNHDKKYGKLDWMFGEPDEKQCSQIHFSRPKAVTEREKHYEHKASCRLMKHSDYMKQQDLEYATKIINKYLFHWWD